MKLYIASEHLERLLDRHELDGWRWEFGDAVRLLGSANYRTHTIRLARHHVLNDPDEVVIDTIRHEVAHALTYQRYGHLGRCLVRSHGKQWKEIAVEVGAEPRATCARTDLTPHPKTLRPKPRRYFYCARCEVWFTRYRKMSRCRYCWPGVLVEVDEVGLTSPIRGMAS